MFDAFRSDRLHRKDSFASVAERIFARFQREAPFAITDIDPNVDRELRCNIDLQEALARPNDFMVDQFAWANKNGMLYAGRVLDFQEASQVALDLSCDWRAVLESLLSLPIVKH